MIDENQSKMAQSYGTWLLSLAFVGFGLVFWAAAPPIGDRSSVLAQTGGCTDGSQCPMGYYCCNGQCVTQ